MDKNELFEIDLFTLLISIPTTIWMVRKGKIPKEILWLFLLWGSHIPMKFYRKLPGGKPNEALGWNKPIPDKTGKT